MNINPLKICFGALALPAFLLLSCEKEDSAVFADIPALTVTSSPTVPSQGGTYTVGYSVSNPASDGTTAYTSDVTWISNISGDGYGTVSFFVEENTGEDLRTGNITVSYAYSEGSSTKYVVENAAVVQYGTGTPAIILNDNVVTASDAGGYLSFEYTIENPAFDGVVSCSTVDDKWIGEFNCAAEGTVLFYLTANEGEEMRIGTIKLTYTYRYGHEISKDITVVQYYPGYGGDVGEIVGTYTASGVVKGDGYSLQTTSWTLTIYPYTGTGEYDILVDGLMPYSENSYKIRGDYEMCALGYYRDGCIVIPSQCSTTMSGTTDAGNEYYVGYTPCIQYTGGSFYYSYYFPDLTFYGSSATGTWESDYGVFLCGCSLPGILSTFYTFVQVITPSISLVRDSSPTAAFTSEANPSTSSVGVPEYRDFQGM